jgi:hypothetical protein
MLTKKFQEFKMTTDIFDFNELKSLPNFGIKDFKDSYYMGEISPENNLRNGLGVCVYENSRLYEGFWERDRR